MPTDTVTQEVGDNPFDFEQFMPPVSTGKLQPAKLPITQVGIHVPGKTEWFRVLADIQAFPANIVYPPDVANAQGEKPPREAHLAALSVALKPEWFDKMWLVPCVNSEGEFFLWPIRRDPENSMAAQHASRNAEIADQAKGYWVKRVSKGRDLPTAELKFDQTTELQRPEDLDPETFLTKYLPLAFKGRLITSNDHPILAKHRG